VYDSTKSIDFTNSWGQLIFDKKTNFKDSIFLDIANFSDITFQNEVYFHGSTFKDRAHFVDSKFQNGAYLGYSIFERNVIFFQTTFEQKLSFDHSTFQNEVEFLNTIFQDEVSFYYSVFQGKVLFKDSSNEKFEKNCFNFYYTKFSNNSYLDFRDCDIKSIIIENLQNYSNFVKFTNIKILENLILKNSNLTKIEFHNLNLTKCKTAIENVSFIGHSGFTIFNNVKWGKNIIGNRDTFRQLKYVNDQQGNIIEANKFYSIEMKKYKEDLKKENCKTHWQDKIIFCINEKVSNFSQSWLRPLICFFIIGLFFFLLSYIDKINSVTYTNIS